MTFSLAATQVLDTQLGELELHGDYYWVDETWFQDDTVRPGESAAFQAQQRERKKHNSIDSYGLLNAKATLRTFDGHWEFSLWGRNLTDKVYFTGLSNFFASVGTAMQYYGEPRTYGASVKYNW
jgi:iron complex outermembrane receptor protein